MRTQVVEDKLNHKKHVFLLRVVSRSSSPFKKDLIARCSTAYVMKDAKIKPPAFEKKILLLLQDSH